MLKYHWHLLQQVFYSTITSTLLHRQYKFIFSRPNRKPLRYLTDYCSDWTVICFSEAYREMYAHSGAREHDHIDCMNKMPNHFSWKVNIWSLPLLFSLKSRVLLKPYTTLSGFPFTKGKDYSRILLAVPLNSGGQRVCTQSQICKNYNTTDPHRNSF